ncbi:hypothetical protein [Streptomyces sp. RPT161]|uniref:hypothetical protein n=1 Tax=Streptomyces sp. RPT161 TaxID=3015993 RepID=UPI0022B878BF|nr:hypothetical protein [Streptomyces sp. RPT161]
MRIELTWPRTGAADRTLTVPVPDVPVAGLLHHARRAWTPSTARRIATYARPVVDSAASAAGAGLLVQLALPFAARLARQALPDTTTGPGRPAGH